MIVTAIIVSWNNKRATLKSIEHVLAQKVDFDLNVIVADNASTDGTVPAIRERFPNVKIIANERNLGGAGGFHVGATEALKRDCDYLWLLDNDAYAQTDCAAIAIRTLENRDHTHAVALGSMILLDSNPQIVQECGGRWNVWTGSIALVNGGISVEKVTEKTIQVDYTPACSLFVRSTAAKQAGLIDPDIFFYFDDIEWCRRLVSSDSRNHILIDTQSRVQHEFGGEKPIVARRLYYSRRNARTFLFDRLRTSIMQDVSRVLYSTLMFHLEILFLILSSRFDLLVSNLIALRDYILNVRGPGKSQLLLSDQVHPFQIGCRADFKVMTKTRLLLVGFNYYSELLELLESLKASEVKPSTIYVLNPTPDLAPALSSKFPYPITEFRCQPTIRSRLNCAFRCLMGHYTVIVGHRRYDSFSMFGTQSFHYDQSGLFYHRYPPIIRCFIGIAYGFFVAPFTIPISFACIVIKSRIWPNQYRPKRP